jgi:hypothetical protein
MGCQIVEPHVKIRCYTARGAGSKLKWTLLVDGLSSVSPTTSYGAPRIAVSICVISLPSKCTSDCVLLSSVICTLSSCGAWFTSPTSASWAPVQSTRRRSAVTPFSFTAPTLDRPTLIHSRRCTSKAQCMARQAGTPRPTVPS